MSCSMLPGLKKCALIPPLTRDGTSSTATPQSSTRCRQIHIKSPPSSTFIHLHVIDEHSFIIAFVRYWRYITLRPFQCEMSLLAAVEASLMRSISLGTTIPLQQSLLKLNKRIRMEELKSRSISHYRYDGKITSRGLITACTKPLPELTLSALNDVFESYANQKVGPLCGTQQSNRNSQHTQQNTHERKRDVMWLAISLGMRDLGL